MAARPSLDDPAMGVYSFTPSLSCTPSSRHRRPPLTTVPLPPVHHHGHRCHSKLISIHTALRSSPIRTIKFDLHYHPSSSMALPPHVLAEPATTPPLPCLSISTPYLQWSIVVLPSRHPFVTVSDVLCTLHHTVSFSATQDELDGLTSDIWPHVHAVFERRVQAHPDWRICERERRCGIRRIDFLLGRTRFLGLSIVANQEGVGLVLDVCL